LNVTYIYDLTSGICIDSVINHIESNKISSDLISKKVIRYDDSKNKPYHKVILTQDVNEDAIYIKNQLDKWYSKNHQVRANGSVTVLTKVTDENRDEFKLYNHLVCLNCECDVERIDSTEGKLHKGNGTRIVDYVVDGISHKKTMVFPMFVHGFVCHECLGIVGKMFEAKHLMSNHPMRDEDDKPVRTNRSGSWRIWSKI
jgi:hypothetical protein